MPAKILLISKKADKSIAKFPLRIQNKIDEAFSKLQANPLAGAKLGGELADNYKFRMGDYRIVYKFDPRESKVEIIKIEHRQGAYK